MATKKKTFVAASKQAKNFGTKAKKKGKGGGGNKKKRTAAQLASIASQGGDPF